MPERRQCVRINAEWVFLLLLVAAAFLVRVWGMSRGHFWDEAVYLQNAEVICCGKTNYSELDSRPPLLSLIFAATFLFWTSVYAASIVTALLNAFGPLFIYLAGRTLVGRLAAALASLLLAFSPFFVIAGNSLLADTPTLTLLLFALWLLVRALRKQTSLNFAAAGFVMSLAVLMRFASLAAVGVLALLVLATARWWRAVLACAAGFVVGFAPYLLWSRVRYGGFLATFLNGWMNFGGPEESRLYYLRNFGNIFSWLTLAGLALWIGRWAWQRTRRTVHGRSDFGSPLRPHWTATFLWIWAVGLFVFYSALPHKELRYIMPAAPPLFLLAGSGLAVLTQGGRTVRIAGGAILAAALCYSFLPIRQRLVLPFIDHSVSDEMEVSDFLNHTVPAGTVLYSNFNYPVFAFYTNLPVYELPEGGPALYDQLNNLPTDGVLIAYKPDTEAVDDPRLDWLDHNAHFYRFREFPTLVVYQYRVEPAAVPPQ